MYKVLLLIAALPLTIPTACSKAADKALADSLKKF